MRYWREHWLANPSKLNRPFLQPFAGLICCKMPHTLRTGTIASNRAGRVWARKTMDCRWRELLECFLPACVGNAVERVRQSTESETMECSRRFPVSSGELSSCGC